MKVLRRSLNKDRISPPTTSPKLPNGGPSTSQYPTQPFASLSLASGPTRLAKQAPSRVIRALSSYRARRVTELSFEAGDFFHVEGERDGTLEGGGAGSVGDEGWFEASNPATGARGLVPKALFQVLGRSARDTPSQPPTPLSFPGQPGSAGLRNGGGPSPASSAASSGYPFPKPQAGAGKSPNGMAMALPSPALSVGTGGARTPGLNGPPSAKTASGSKSQPLYGIVQYDFTAERNDELEAKKGEPIIVIAQSNHEWFVAKPIGRLGGPGLIPVTFVEIQDVTTGKAMPAEKVEELIRSAVVPRVEDWKKATAAYKGNSIPLGRFDFPGASGAQNQQASSQRTPASTPGFGQPSPNQVGDSKPLVSPGQQSTSSSQSHQQRQASTSIPPSHSRQQSAGGRQVTSNYEASAPRNGASGSHTSQTSTSYPPQHLSHSSPSLGQETSPTGSNYAGKGAPEPTPDEDENYATIEELRDRYGVVVHASVESFHFEQGHFWFHLRAHFARPMADSPGQNDVTVLVLYRLYQDFYDFQIALMDAFPVEAGRVDQNGMPLSPAAGSEKRILPMMPGPADEVDELICAQRVHDLGIYLGELSQLPHYIRECELVYEFLGPREGDVELEGHPNLPQTAESAEGEVVEYLDKMTPREPLPSALTAGSKDSTQQRNEQSHASVGSHSSQGYPRTDSRLQSGPTATSQRSSPPVQSATSSERTSGLPSSTHSSSSSQPVNKPASAALAAAQQQGFLRIKIYQHRTDDLIAIRVPTTVTHGQLLDRIRERIGPAINHMRFRDESGRGYSTGGTAPIQASGGGRLVALDNDDDLLRWLDAGQRMVLYAD